MPYFKIKGPYQIKNSMEKLLNCKSLELSNVFSFCNEKCILPIFTMARQFFSLRKFKCNFYMVSGKRILNCTSQINVSILKITPRKK